jgi:hypothetical protein
MVLGEGRVGIAEFYYLEGGLFFGFLVAAGLTVISLARPDYTIACRCAWAAAVLFGSIAVVWGITTMESAWIRIPAVGAVGFIAAISLSEAIRFIRARELIFAVETSAAKRSDVLPGAAVQFDDVENLSLQHLNVTGFEQALKVGKAGTAKLGDIQASRDGKPVPDGLILQNGAEVGRVYGVHRTPFGYAFDWISHATSFDPGKEFSYENSTLRIAKAKKSKQPAGEDGVLYRDVQAISKAR